MLGIKLFISSLLVAVTVLSGMGFLWWNHPPEKLAASATGGQVILVLAMLGSSTALWLLWARDASSAAQGG